MQCQEVMRKVVQCARPGETVTEIAMRMRDCGIGFLPVCDAEGVPVGAVTDRDLVTRCIAAGRPNESTPVEEVMSPDPVTCLAVDDLRVAEELMGVHQKSRIMCTSLDGKLMGVISLSDIAQFELRGRSSDLLRSVSEREVHS